MEVSLRNQVTYNEKTGKQSCAFTLCSLWVKCLLHNNLQYCNLIGPYHIPVIGPRNLPCFTRPFSSCEVWSGHETTFALPHTLTHPLHPPSTHTLCSSICCWSTLASSSGGVDSSTASCQHGPPPTPWQPTEQSQQTDHYSGLEGPNYHYLQPTKYDGQCAIYNPQSAPYRGIRNTAGFSVHCAEVLKAMHIDPSSIPIIPLRGKHRALLLLS